MQKLILMFVTLTVVPLLQDAQAAESSVNVPLTTIGVPGPAMTVLPLSMAEAIRRAIQTNLTAQLARATTQDARGQAIQAAAALLPQITGTLSQSRIFKINLAAEGIGSIPIIPNAVIGPYNVFDARLRLVQKLLDVNALLTAKASRINLNVARAQEVLAQEQVASAAALVYIEDLRTLQDVSDAETNLALGQQNAALSHHQESAGLATSVDSARSDTTAAQNNQTLIQARLAAMQADIRLKRMVGLDLSMAVEIFPPMPSNSAAPSDEHGQTLPTLAAALSEAHDDRLELQIAKAQIDANTDSLSAAKASYLPTISANADYGFSGTTADSNARTGQIGGSLNLPIFDGGLIHGQVVEAKAIQSEAQSQLADDVAQVEEDVRLALLMLPADAEGMKTADLQVQLAERELTLAQNRYSAGVGDNIQVVTAQASLADARKSRVDTRANYADALANLALATGRMRHFSF